MEEQTKEPKLRAFGPKRVESIDGGPVDVRTVSWNAHVGTLPDGRIIGEVPRKRASLVSSVSFPSEAEARAWIDLVASRLDALPRLVRPAPVGWSPPKKAPKLNDRSAPRPHHRGGHAGNHRDQRKVAA